MWSECAWDKERKGFSAPCVQVGFSPSPSCAQDSPGTGSRAMLLQPPGTLENTRIYPARNFKPRCFLLFSSMLLFSSPQRRHHALGLICKPQPFLQWINFSLLGEKCPSENSDSSLPSLARGFLCLGEPGGDAVLGVSGCRSVCGQSRRGCGRKGSRVLPGWSVSPGFCTLM